MLFKMNSDKKVEEKYGINETKELIKNFKIVY
jgi:hypothetical protein